MKTNHSSSRPWAGPFWSFGLRALAGALLLGLGASPGIQAQLPVIVTQPADTNVCEGEDLTFCVDVENPSSVSYQWRYYRSGASYTNIPNATQACLTLINWPVTATAGVRVEVSNSIGSVLSITARFAVRSHARITRQPADVSVPAGEPASFSVEATGTAPLAYQWYFNNQPVAGKTNASLTLSGVQPANEGNYHVIISNFCGAVASETARLRTIGHATFTRITTGPLVTDSGNAAIGGHTGDYDADGYLDVFVSRFVSTPSSLYHNNGDGTFASVTNGIFPVSTNDTGGVWADFDNDGRSDLFVFNWQIALTPSYFVFPNADGSFTKVGFEPQSPGGVSAADLDQDGLLDLCAFRGDRIVTNRLYRNVNGRSFQPFSKAEAGDLLGTNAIYGAGAWADYDDDGAMDLFTPSGSIGVNGCKLYRNDGHGHFTTVTNRIILDGLVTGQQAAAWGDYDNDGRVDLCIAESGSRTNSVVYRNLGAGQFERTSVGLSIPTTFLLAWVDYDNDGFLDLFMSAAPNGRGLALFRNGGNGTFARITAGAIATTLPAEPFSSSTGNWFDYDNDGFLDLLVGNGHCCQTAMAANYLYHNNGNSNAWLKVKLVGTLSNRDAVGAKVRVKATFAGTTRWQRRDITAGDVFGGNNKPLAHFGLGDATIVETLRVEWPSGQLTEMHDVAVRQHLTITEAPGLRTTGLVQGTMPLQITAHPGMNIQLNVANEIEDSGVPLITRPQTNRIDTVVVPDDGQPPRRFYKARVQQ